MVINLSLPLLLLMIIPVSMITHELSYLTISSFLSLAFSLLLSGVPTAACRWRSRVFVWRALRCEQAMLELKVNDLSWEMTKNEQGNARNCDFSLAKENYLPGLSKAKVSWNHPLVLWAWGGLSSLRCDWRHLEQPRGCFITYVGFMAATFPAA